MHHRLADICLCSLPFSVSPYCCRIHAWTMESTLLRWPFPPLLWWCKQQASRQLFDFNIYRVQPYLFRFKHEGQIYSRSLPCLGMMVLGTVHACLSRFSSTPPANHAQAHMTRAQDHFLKRGWEWCFWAQNCCVDSSQIIWTLSSSVLRPGSGPLVWKRLKTNSNNKKKKQRLNYNVKTTANWTKNLEVIIFNKVRQRALFHFQ